MSKRSIDQIFITHSFDEIRGMLNQAALDVQRSVEFDKEQSELVQAMIELCSALCYYLSNRRDVNSNDKRRAKQANKEMRKLYFAIYSKIDSMNRERNQLSEQIQNALPQTSDKEKATRLEKAGYGNAYKPENELSPSYQEIFAHTESPRT